MSECTVESFESAVGLGRRGKISVNTNLWDEKGGFHQMKIKTSVSEFQKANRQKARYSVRNTVNLMAQGDKKSLEAILYRAKRSEQKGQAVCDRNSCFVGVLKAK